VTYGADSGGMPSLVPADPASERALRASPLVPTLSFAALGLATMVAIGALGLAQHPSAAPSLAAPSISVRPPDLTLAGAPAEARAVAPEVARVLPVELPAAGSLRTPASAETVVPVVEPGQRSSGGSATHSRAGSAQEVPLAVGRGARVAAGLPGKDAAAGSSRSADGADRPLAAARKPSRSPQPVPAPRRSGTAPVGGHRTTAPAPKPTKPATPSKPSSPQGGVSTPAPGRTSVVPETSPVQGPLLMAARPRGVRVAVVTTTITPPTPVAAKQQDRQKRRGSQAKQDNQAKHEHPAKQEHQAKQDRQAKHENQAKQHRQAKQDRKAKQHRPAKHEHQARHNHQAEQQHRAGHGHGRNHRG